MLTNALPEASLLSLHLPLTPATRGLLGPARRSTEDLLRVLAGVPPLNPVALPGG